MRKDENGFKVDENRVSENVPNPSSSRWRSVEPGAVDAIAEIVDSFKSGKSFVKTMDGPLRKYWS